MTDKAEPVRYRCENPRCTLGTAGAPGHFTGGILPEQVTMLTGRPPEHLDDGEHGEGVCPNCGTPGVAETEETG